MSDGMKSLGWIVLGMLVAPGAIATTIMKVRGHKTLPSVGVGVGVSVAVLGALRLQGYLTSVKLAEENSAHEARVAACEAWKAALKIPDGQSFEYDGVSASNCWDATERKS